MSTAVIWSKSKPDVDCRIPICWTFGRIPRHVIPQPPATLQGAATWWIHCHDSRATCNMAGCDHLAKSLSWSCHIAWCNNSIRHIENRFFAIFIFFCFFSMQIGLWRAAAFVSSPIHLFVTFFTLRFSELSLVGLALDLVDLQCYDSVGWVTWPIKSSTYTVSSVIRLWTDVISAALCWIQLVRVAANMTGAGRAAEQFS